MRKTVVIAAPDAHRRNRMVHLVETLPGFGVVARTADLMNTYNEVEERLPGIVLISDVLASLPEFEVMRALFRTLGVRWLVMTSAHPASRPGQALFGGRETGADLMCISAEATPDVFARQIHALAQSDRHGAPKGRPGPPRPQETAWRGAEMRQAAPVSARPARFPQQIAAAITAMPGPQASAPGSAGPDDRVILIGASTGGVDAIMRILSRFPADCPPTLVVQHTGPGFGESLAGLLDRQCLPTVRLASGTETVTRGQILIGAGTGAHLVLLRGAATRATLVEKGPVSGHVPSVDMLFLSAVPVAARVSAVLLTGMGRDGAAGLKALHDAGAFTIAQDQASCVVYGMPRAAVECGAVRKILPLDRIGEALLAETAADGTRARGMQK